MGSRRFNYETLRFSFLLIKMCFVGLCLEYTATAGMRKAEV